MTAELERRRQERLDSPDQGIEEFARYAELCFDMITEIIRLRGINAGLEEEISRSLHWEYSNVRLRAVIRDAPHEEDCEAFMAIEVRCTCWKREAIDGTRNDGDK